MILEYDTIECLIGYKIKKILYSHKMTSSTKIFLKKGKYIYMTLTKDFKSYAKPWRVI